MMIKKLILFLVLTLLTSQGSFAQSGKRDGIHQEFYKNKKLKYEYIVKNEKFSGFYERYDEQGELEYRQYFIDGIFDGTDRENYYYELFTWYHHIGDVASEVQIDIEKAKKLFGEDYEFVNEPFAGNWMGIIRTRIPKNGGRKKRYPVTLSGISKNYVYIKEFHERDGSENRKHHFYDLIRIYRVERDEAIDRLFNADLIVEVFQHRHTAVEYGMSHGRWRKREGSRLWSVEQYLGEPDYSRELGPSGWFDVYYADENLRIIGHNSAVYFMEKGRPQWASSSKHKNARK